MVLRSNRSNEIVLNGSSYLKRVSVTHQSGRRSFWPSGRDQYIHLFLIISILRDFEVDAASPFDASITACSQGLG